MRASPLALLVLLACAGCGGSSGCEDPDRDGFGPGCEAGDDCDPNNAARNINCESVPPPDCAATPDATGCPCLMGSRSSCLGATAGVGMCTAGSTQCVSGHWHLCEGGIGPTTERCNGEDDDCDGVVDEGVLSPCGGCNSSCSGGVWGEEPEPFEASEALALTRFGELTLAPTEQRFGALWIANSGDGTVSRIDVASAVETARYQSGGTEPSRIAVDHLGDAWVVNREFGGVPSVTRFFGEAERCQDRGMDGLTTSSGPDDVLELADDDCVALHVPVGEAGAVARAIAIDGDMGLDGISGGDAWVGLHDAEAIVELDGLTGAELRRVETPGFAPYAATFDRWGTLWVIERGGVLARIDPRPTVPTVEFIDVPLACFLLYGLATDLEGRLLMTGFSCDLVAAYDPAEQRWQTRASSPSPRSATFDGHALVWVAHTGAQVSAVRLDPFRVERAFGLRDAEASPIETIGVAVDALDQVWAISSYGGMDTGGRELGIATRLDPETGEITAQIEVGNAPHVQGDLVGNRVRYGLVPTGTDSHIFAGCGAEVETEWTRVHVAADPGAYGRVTVEMRHAASEAALRAAEFSPLGVIPDSPSPYPLRLPTGGALEIRLTLDVDGRIGAPRVRRVGVEWSCPGPG